jgi:hypothetical protein
MGEGPDSVRCYRIELQNGPQRQPRPRRILKTNHIRKIRRAVIWATILHISNALGCVPARPLRRGGREGRGSAIELFGSFPPASEREARMDDPDDPMIWSRLGRIRNVALRGLPNPSGGPLFFTRPHKILPGLQQKKICTPRTSFAPARYFATLEFTISPRHVFLSAFTANHLPLGMVGRQYRYRGWRQYFYLRRR